MDSRNIANTRSGGHFAATRLEHQQYRPYTHLTIRPAAKHVAHVALCVCLLSEGQRPKALVFGFVMCLWCAGSVCAVVLQLV